MATFEWVDCLSHNQIRSDASGNKRVSNVTRRCDSRRTEELIRELNPTLRGWGEYYKRAHVRTLFHKLDGWIVRRIWSHRYRRWRVAGWKQLPAATLYDELGLVNLFSLIPSLPPLPRLGAFSCEEAVCRKSARTVWSGGRRPARERASLRPDWHCTTTLLVASGIEGRRFQSTMNLRKRKHHRVSLHY